MLTGPVAPIDDHVTVCIEPTVQAAPVMGVATLMPAFDPLGAKGKGGG